MSFKRAEKVAEAIKREVGILLLQEVRDPAVHFVTVTSAEVSNDLRHAKVFVSILGDEGERENCMAGLRRATSFLRAEVGRRIQLRYAPEIRFYLDNSLDHAMKITAILNDLKNEGKKPKAKKRTKKAKPED